MDAVNLFISLPLHSRIDCGGDGSGVCLPAHRRNNFFRSILGHVFDALQSTGAYFSDLLFTFSRFRCDFSVSLLNGVIKISFDLCFGLGNDIVGFGARVSEGFVIGVLSFNRFCLQIFGRSQIVGNRSLAL